MPERGYLYQKRRQRGRPASLGATLSRLARQLTGLARARLGDPARAALTRWAGLARERLGTATLFARRWILKRGPIPWRSYAPILLLGAVGMGATLLVRDRVSDLEHLRVQSAFAEASRDRVLVIQREVEFALAVVRDIGSFFDASRLVSRRQFREFVGPAIKRSASIASLEWAPLVGDTQRETFLTQARRTFPRFRIIELDAAGEISDAERRGESYPVLYVQPYQANRDVLGLDLASVPSEQAALKSAAAAGRMVVSPPVALRSREEEKAGFVAYLPLYERPEPEEPGEAEDWQEPGRPPGSVLRGFAIGRFVIGQIIEDALRNLGAGGVDMRFVARDAEGKPRTVHFHASRAGAEAQPLDTAAVSLLKPHTGTIQVANREWTVVSTPVPGRFEPPGWSGGVVLVGGLAFTVLSMFYLFTLIGQKEQIRRLVALRTLELEQSNAALNKEVTERRRAESALQLLNATLEQRVARRTAEAERRAQELEQFAYVASHDLKAPLRAVSNLAAWLGEDLREKLTPEAKEQLDLLRDRVARMHALIEGLLTYSRIGRTHGSVELVDTGELVADTIDSLAPPKGFRVLVARNMPILFADRLHLGQVFANLISNGIKHHHLKRGRIRVSGRDLGTHCEFEVEDDGPGIPPEYHKKVFMMFQTLNVKDYAGDTGIGLALVKKLVEEQGGTIELDSEPGRGSRFRFTWTKIKPPERTGAASSGGDAR